MLFIQLTLSFVVGSLLASAIAMVVMFKLLTSPKFIKWYFNWMKDFMEKYSETLDDIF